jgi:hypothetical protein
MKNSTTDQKVAGEAASLSYTETAQQHVEQLHALRDTLPNLKIPVTTRAGQNLAAAAALPPEFVELVSMAVKNHPALAKAGLDADAIRDLSTFAGAYDPVADEFEATAHFLRHSITAARHKAGKAALLGYEVAKRLAEDPENAGLAEYVADMARALGFRERAAKAKANKRKAAAAAGTAAPPAVTPSKP